MSNKMIIGISIVIVSAFMLTSCNNGNYLSNNKKLSEQPSLYSKNEEHDYSYRINSSKITINSNCSNLKISKNDSNEIKINMKKNVCGKSEKKAQEALDNIKCNFKYDVINIGPEDDDNKLINSRDIETTISIPASATSLDIQSNVGNVELEGNYDSLKSKMKVGNLSYKGELKQGNMISDVGDIELNLKNLESNYKYKIDGKVGDVKIIVPKESSINLIGSMVKDVGVAKGISFNDNSSTFDINKTTSFIETYD